MTGDHFRKSYHNYFCLLVESTGAELARLDSFFPLRGKKFFVDGQLEVKRS